MLTLYIESQKDVNTVLIESQTGVNTVLIEILIDIDLIFKGYF